VAGVKERNEDRRIREWDDRIDGNVNRRKGLGEMERKGIKGVQMVDTKRCKKRRIEGKYERGHLTGNQKGIRGRGEGIGKGGTNGERSKME